MAPKGRKGANEKGGKRGEEERQLPLQAVVRFDIPALHISGNSNNNSNKEDVAKGSNRFWQIPLKRASRPSLSNGRDVYFRWRTRRS
jgi:hypothetical protein